MNAMLLSEKLNNFQYNPAYFKVTQNFYSIQIKYSCIQTKCPEISRYNYIVIKQIVFMIAINITNFSRSMSIISVGVVHCLRRIVLIIIRGKFW